LIENLFENQDILFVAVSTGMHRDGYTRASGQKYEQE
jgi:hypothetical protein